MRWERLILPAALAACLLGVSGYGQDEDAATKLAALGKKASEVNTIHLFAFVRGEDRLVTDKPRGEVLSVFEVWYDAKNGLMRWELVTERSVYTRLVDAKGAHQWQTQRLSPKVVGKVRRRDRAEYLPAKDKLSTSAGPAGFLLDALNGYSALLKTCTVQPDTEKDEMGLENVTRFVLTADAGKDAEWAHEMKDSKIRLAIDNDSGLVVCLRMEGKKQRVVVTVPRVETGGEMSGVFVLPPAAIQAGIVDAKTGRPVAD